MSKRQKRQYHIGLAKGEIAPYVLLCGDPARAGKISRRFEKIKLERSNREYVTFTGTYKGLDVSVMGHGIGPDNMEIAVVELCQLVKNPTLIRIGTCGALQKDIKLGDLVISTGAVRLENTSTAYVPEGYPATAHYEALVALISAASQLGARSHVGLTASAPGFYGAQGRSVPGFPSRFPDLPKDLAGVGVLNLEMEISCLFTLAQLSGARAGAVCAVFANRPHNRFAGNDIKERSEKSAIDAGLTALTVLARMDKWKQMRRKKNWHV